MAMPRPRLTRRASIQLTAGPSVPTMRRATTSTRRTGQSRISSHMLARTRTSWIIVAGDTSNRTTRVFASPEGRPSGSGGPVTAAGRVSFFTFCSSASA